MSQRRIERALEREKELVEQILETNPLGITVLTADGTFARLNTRAEQLFGRSRRELLGRQLTQSEWRLFDENNQLIPVKDRPTTQVLETGKSIRDWEAKIERLDGQYKWVSVNAAPITNPDGTITHFVFTTEDITERKHRERELKHQIEALQPLNRYNTIVRAVTEATVEESTVAGIEQVVCETFASFDLYSFAVIGEFTPDEEFVPRSWGESTKRNYRQSSRRIQAGIFRWDWDP
ncbi:PAS domain S-box protein [Halocatena marina]|uniref:PAS domain S-box protein n=1 Tax=Halocatena marina TaxID=2934937 RepID=UPI00360A5002